jgi:hypothetical protein
VVIAHNNWTTYLEGPHLAAHPEFAWQKPVLKDMKSQPWTVFEAAQ